MNSKNLIAHRLTNQKLAPHESMAVSELVSWMAAIQAQEYASAKWALGLRLPGLKDSDIENAFNGGEIIRTHVLRPTWHFVSPKDIRWMLELTAPRIKAISSYMFRKSELNEKIFKRSNARIMQVLRGGNHLTRSNLQEELAKVKIFSDGQRLSYLMMVAELDGIICSGRRRGNQFTYALLEDRVPRVKSLHREEALAELTKRYFNSHGPATLKDFSTWSGLSMIDAKNGMSMVTSKFKREKIEGEEYYFSHDSAEKSLHVDKRMLLLPTYDELIMGYKNRNAIVAQCNRHIPELVFNSIVLLNGYAAGTRRRVSEKKNNLIEIKPWNTFACADALALKKALKEYENFTGIKTVLI